MSIPKRSKKKRDLDTEVIFKRTLNISIGLLMLVTVNMVLNGVIQSIHGLTPAYFLPSLIASFITPLVYVANLLVFSIVGKDKGKDNRIMAFVFGVCTIALAGLLILERALTISTYVEKLALDLQGIPSNSINIADSVLRISSLGLVIAVISFSIMSIVNSAGLIKENMPSLQKKPAKTAAVKSKPIISPPIDSPTLALPGSRPRLCSSCGATLESAAMFCNKCGVKA
jgi:hypothetical protein